jgi:alpha-N-arabinofuranosidase
MRNDLAQMVADMRPAALRFPGGCFVEGLNSSTAVNFTRGVGPIETRPGHYNMWQYYSNDRVGLFEYLQFCEDIGTHPVYVVNLGLWYGSFSPPDPVEPWIDHALGAIEFAIGDAATTYWGGVRASMGHPAPFSLRYLALGNENYGNLYAEQHYLPAYNAIRAKYTREELTLIANFNVSALNMPTDMFDYHTYPPAEDFYTMQYQWDAVMRPSPLVFNSEYAAKAGAGMGNLHAALAEAAWMIGLERNSDLVVIACYAPLFVRKEDADWLPDAIRFDALSAYGTPSYWNQVAFSNNNAPGSVLLGYNVSASAADRAAVGTASPPFAAGTPLASNAANFSISVSLDPGGSGSAPAVVFKMVNYASVPRTFAVSLQGIAAGGGKQQPTTGLLTSLSSPSNDLGDENSFEEPERIVLVNSTVATGVGDCFLLPPYSIHVLRMVL